MSERARFAGLHGLWLCVAMGVAGCAGASTGLAASTGAVAMPVVAQTAAQNGAQIVSLSDANAGAAIYYTLDGSVPTTTSVQYFAPFLMTTNATVKAIAVVSGQPASAVASELVTANAAPGSLVWSDEFANNTASNAQPNPAVWTYDTGASGFGNAELEDYCAWGSNASPCSAAKPNAYVGTDGYLHIVAQQPAPGVYTSARLKSQGLFSFQYGRLEFRAMMPEAQGLWPAAWMLGNAITTKDWPACGELDVMERVNAATMPDWNMGSVHGPGFTGTNLGTKYDFPTGVTAAGWHTYGVIWKPGSVAYYVDDPTKPYVTYSAASLQGLSGASWPFDNVGPNFLILNLAVGGQWPGSPTSATPFPSEIVMDYVRLYAN